MGVERTTAAALPVAIIGAGPIGLAAAAYLVGRGLPFVLLEAGAAAGAAIREWGHVRLFSPWRYNIDTAARRLLDATGWTAPDGDALPTGHEIVDRYLEPLSRHAAIRPHLRFGARVLSVGREDFDKVRTTGRDRQPFELRLADGSTLDARAVIDASGTWRSPNPLGSGGVALPGERDCAGRLAYGIPDVLDRARARYARKHVLVVGSGHSAMNVILDLIQLQDDEPETRITWALRRDSFNTVFGGGTADALPARGRLGIRVRAAIKAGQLRALMPFRIRGIGAGDGLLQVSGMLGDIPHTTVADEVIVTTGFRTDLDMLREIRLSLDPWLEAPSLLAPLIDPNLHSCGTVRPHGARELAHPETDFFIAGMKSYGRAPTFLMATGYEQARSIAAWLAGDTEAADKVELDLPETGVCSVTPEAAEPAAGCCGGPAPAGSAACCVQDAAAKADGDAGCGCTAESAEIPVSAPVGCCR